MTKFKTVLLDPPWNESGGGGRGAQNHYPLIKTRHEMIATILSAKPWADVDREGAHVYMWSTDNYLTWALWLFEALGVKHHRCLPWTKKRMGLGQYFRGCHELLLFGTIGKGKAVMRPGTMRTDALVGAPPVMRGGKRVHSAKPDHQYDVIEARSKGPYLELFARETRDGWTAWGDEIDANH